MRVAFKRGTTVLHFLISVAFQQRLTPVFNMLKAHTFIYSGGLFQDGFYCNNLTVHKFNVITCIRPDLGPADSYLDADLHVHRVFQNLKLHTKCTSCSISTTRIIQAFGQTSINRVYIPQ